MVAEVKAVIMESVRKKKNDLKMCGQTITLRMGKHYLPYTFAENLIKTMVLKMPYEQ